MSEFRMPSLGADMEAGTLVEWLKKPGDPVARGDIIAVVETEKGAIEVEVFDEGVIDRFLVDLGATVPVGTPLALLRGKEEAAPSPAELLQPAPVMVEPIPRPLAGAAPAPKVAAPSPHVPPPPALATGAAGARPLASPAARRLAAERGIDLATVSGTGPGGAIVTTDVEAAATLAAQAGVLPKGGPAPRPQAGADIAAMRHAIAAAMTRSKREIPHYYLATTIDMAAAACWLAETNTARPPAQRLLLPVLLVKAVALALRRMPEFNGLYIENRFQPSERIHVGTAIAIRGGGLVAPALHDADRLGLDELMAKFRDLVARVRQGRFRSSELSDPTITVTSLGERGVDTVFGVIFPPQVAIVGFGRMGERPGAVAGRIEVRPSITVTLAGDHRVSDGHRGALFLAEIDALLQHPEAL